MAERQSHGFIFEQKVLNYYGLYETSYTNKNDSHIPKNNKLIMEMGITIESETIPISIKTFKEGSELPLSDIFNNFHRESDFILLVGKWKGKKDNIIEIRKIHVDIEKWKKLFIFNEYKELKHWIKYEVKNSYDYDKSWKSEMEMWKRKWGKYRIIQPRFKRDHKTQRRIQCAVPNKFIENFFNEIKK